METITNQNEIKETQETTEMEYDSNLITINDLYEITPESLGFSNNDSYYDSDEYF